MNLKNAIQSLEQIKQPNSDIYLELGYAYKQMEHYTIALDYYLKAYPTLANNVFLVSEIAQIYELMEDYENELVYLKQASRLGREESLVISSFYLFVFIWFKRFSKSKILFRFSDFNVTR